MNKLTATVKFDFKGKHHQLSSEIDFDKAITHEDFYNFVYLIIARENNIGLYTYELEIMMDQNIVFSDAKGNVEGCISNGELDLERVKLNQQKSECLLKIKPIIKRFESDNDLTTALVDAYLLGINS
ncbi:MAG TPA: hypothetical protein EYP92_08405 [Candidatus Thioglobus sp.]|jgi:hypothetical protein|nr:hypothetical protein [Candidatus Thioglobus sp.]